MMPSYQTISGILAAVLGMAGYAPYIVDIVRGRTRPHAFTWLIWTILAGITFVAQITEGAGLGAALTAITGTVSALITIFAMFRGVKVFALIDWLSLFGAAISIALWMITGDPFLTVLLVVIIDIFAAIPLVRHCYLKPYEETPSMFGIYFFAWTFSTMALSTITLTTSLYPIYNIVMNAIITATIIYRRKKTSNDSR